MRGPTVDSVMTTKVITARPDTPFKELVELLDTNKISAVPVVDDDGTLLGVVSEGDLLAKEEYRGGTEPLPLLSGTGRRQRWRKSSGLTASDVMTKPVITIAADAPVVAAAHRLAEAHVHRLFVVEPGGRLAGVLSRRDMLKLYLRSDAEIREDVIHEVLARALWADPSSVQVQVNDGVVTLIGRFERRSEVEIAVRLTAARPGVVGVVNELTFDRDDLVATMSTGL